MKDRESPNSAGFGREKDNLTTYLPKIPEVKQAKKLASIVIILK